MNTEGLKLHPVQLAIRRLERLVAEGIEGGGCEDWSIRDREQIAIEMQSHIEIIKRFVNTGAATGEPVIRPNYHSDTANEVQLRRMDAAPHVLESYAPEFLQRDDAPMIGLEDTVSCAECGHEYAADTKPKRCSCGAFL